MKKKPSQKKIRQKNFEIFCIRALIVGVWTFALMGLLYAPDYMPSLLNQRSISILIWPGIFEPQVIDDFEKRTGIKVNISYFESNEELLSKVRVTGGAGYDLLLPSDYAIDQLVRAHILKPLNKEKLHFWSRLNPMLLGHYYDKDNTYSVPISWDVSGIGYNASMIDPAILDWQYIFDRNVLGHHNTVMTNDALEAVLTAALYLYGSIEDIDQAKLDEIEQLLRKQRSFIEAYTEYRPDYYIITKNAATAYMASIYLWRSIGSYPEIDFMVPKSGTLMTIESFVIPKDSAKDKLVYEFLNYMFEPETEQRNVESFALLPATRYEQALDDLPVGLRKLLKLKREDMKYFYFPHYNYFKKPIDEQHIRDLWIRIKA